MFGEYILALIKVCYNIAFAIMTAIPFYYAWNSVASTYFYFVPEVYHTIPYWNVVGIFLSINYIGEQIASLTPKLVSVTQNNS